MQTESAPIAARRDDAQSNLPQLNDAGHASQASTTSVSDQVRSLRPLREAAGIIVYLRLMAL